MEEITERIKKAEKKAIPLIRKYEKMSVDETLRNRRENREEVKKDYNIIHRYYNHIAKDAGYARGIEQARKEMKEEGE